MHYFLSFMLAAAADPDALIKAAEPIRSLENFLEAFVGECHKGEPEQKKDCQAKAADFRKAAKDKTFLTDLPGSLAKSLRPVRSKDDKNLIYDFTPFFDAGGYGMTFGKPIGQDRDGDPRIRSSQLKVPATGSGESAVLDGFKYDRTNVQLVFKPVEVWKLPKKGERGGFWYGISVKPVLLRLQESRSGETADTVY